MAVRHSGQSLDKLELAPNHFPRTYNHEFTKIRAIELSPDHFAAFLIEDSRPGRKAK